MNELTKKFDLNDFFQKQKNQIKAALPSHLTPERMLRVCLTEIRKNERLSMCTPISLIGSIIQTSQLGLEPGNGLGHAYLIPYENKKKGVYECQFMIGYRGMLDLARRSGQISSISAHEIYENDLFEFEYGIEEKLKHIPFRGERGELIGVYAIAKLKGDSYQFEVMWIDEVEKIRKQSRSSNNGPWVTHYVEMVRKTAIRRLFKYLPVSVEIQRAAILDELADAGLQDNSSYIDAEFEKEEPKKSKVEELAELTELTNEEKEQILLREKEEGK